MTSEKEYIAVVRVNRKGNPLVFKVIAKNINECSKDLRAQGYSILRLLSSKNKLGQEYYNRMIKDRQKKSDDFVELMLDYMKDKLNYYAKVYLKNSLYDIKHDFRQQSLDEAYKSLNYNFELHYIIKTLKKALKDGTDFNHYFEHLKKISLPKLNENIANEIKSILINQAEKLGRKITTD